jgi:spore coat polysaccharide biosynthesis predicted glycosyltransferase SpsG
VFRILGIALAGGKFHTGHAVRLVNLYQQAPEEFSTDLAIVTDLENLPLPPGSGKPELIPFDSVASASLHLSRTIAKANPDAVLFDCLSELADLKTEIAKKIPTIVFDDDSRRCDGISILVNAVLGDWNGGISRQDNGIVATGPEFVVIPQGIGAARRKRSFSKGINLLVSLGGADPTRSTLRVLQALERSLQDSEGISPQGMHRLSVLVLASRDHPDYAVICERMRRFGWNLGWGVDIVSVLRWADLAITGGGMTALECASAGVPSLVIPARNHERRTAELLAERGCAAVFDPDLPEKLDLAINSFLLSTGKLEAMAKAGPAVVDGRGADRIWELIRGLFR